MEKQCTKCREILTLDDFPKHKDFPDGLDSWCKQCHSLYCKHWRHTYTVKQRRKEWLRTPAGKERRRSEWRRWKRTPGGKAHTIRHQQSELGKSYKARVNYKRRTGTGEIEKFRNEEIFERDNWKCHVCGKAVNKDLDSRDALSATLDHLIPISLGGGHTKLNIKTAHRRCNSQRGNSKSTQLVLV